MMEYLNSCNLCSSSIIQIVDKKYHICKCEKCGYIFYNPRPKLEEIINFYSRDNKYDSWLSAEQGRTLLWKRRLALVRRYKKDGILLDVGAGTGEFLSLAKQHYQIFGTEVSTSALRIAQNKYKVYLFNGQVADVDFGNTQFDVITLFHVLEHVPFPSHTLDVCKLLLKNDGVLIIAVPNDISSLNSVLKRPFKGLISLFTVLGLQSYGVYGLPAVDLEKNPDEIHLSHFTESSLKFLFKIKGLTIIDKILDPYYAAIGIRLFISEARYQFFKFIYNKFGSNFYETMWFAVSKNKDI